MAGIQHRQPRLVSRGGALQLPALAAAPRLAAAQPWPAKPLRWVAAVPPGGTTDAVTRLAAAEVSRSLQQSITVDNKPAAGTVIGVDLVAKAIVRKARITADN